MKIELRGIPQSFIEDPHINEKLEEIKQYIRTRQRARALELKKRFEDL